MSDHPSILSRSAAEMPSLFSLAFPITVGLVASTLIGVVDTIMIAPLGTVPLAAASLTTSTLMVMYSMLYGLVAVLGVGFAQALGADDTAAISSQFRNGLLSSAGAGALSAAVVIAFFPFLGWLGQPDAVLAILLPYWIAMALLMIPFAILYAFKSLLEAINRPWIAVGVVMIGVCVNVPFNWLLIYGIGDWPGLGLLGAGIASLLSESTALLLAFLFWRYSRSMAAFRQASRLSVTKAWEQLKTAAPVCIGYAGEAGAYAIVGVMLGWFGAAALAANQVVTTIATVMYMVPLGMAAAVSVRIGLAIGADERSRLRPIAYGGLAIVTLWMSALTVGLILLAPTLAGALSSDPEVVRLAVLMFIAVALMQIIDGIQATSLGALRGMLDVKTPTAWAMVAYWLVALPAAYLIGMPLDFGPVGMWVGYTVGLLVVAVVLPLRFLRLTKADTVPNPAKAAVNRALSAPLA